MFLGLFKSYPRVPMVVRGVLIFFSLSAVAINLCSRRLQPLPRAAFSTLYVFGDSITAGLGRAGETNWPVLFRAEHQVIVVDRSRAGCSVGQALKFVDQGASQDGVVLIELGGNDVIGRTSPQQFATDLEQLAARLQNPRSAIVMFELPLFPLDNAYGLVQRDVARRHHICLIPRRYLARIFALPGATVDGLHLTNVGQRQLADLIWEVTRPAFDGK